MLSAHADQLPFQFHPSISPHPVLRRGVVILATEKERRHFLPKYLSSQSHVCWGKCRRGFSPVCRNEKQNARFGRYSLRLSPFTFPHPDIIPRRRNGNDNARTRFAHSGTSLSICRLLLCRLPSGGKQATTTMTTISPGALRNAQSTRPALASTLMP